MTARVRVGTRLDPETERPRLLAWAEANKRTEAEAIRLLVMEALDARDASSSLGSAIKAAADLPVVRIDAETIRRVARQRPAARSAHQFKAGQNPLKCETCGMKAGEHR